MLAKITFIKFLVAFMLTVVLLPTFSFAANNTGSGSQSGDDSSWWPLVQCGVDSPGHPEWARECGFKDLVATVARISRFLIILGLSVAAIAFAWAGILYMTAAGNTEQINEAHRIFTKVVIGFVLMLSAWLIVKFIQDQLITGEGYKDIDEFAN